eukprot:1161327-Pelagomonas_calceolata.AAC.1
MVNGGSFRGVSTLWGPPLLSSRPIDWHPFCARGMKRGEDGKAACGLTSFLWVPSGTCMRERLVA